MTTTAVIGGGLAGALAAKRLRMERPSEEITLIEQEPRLGGRLRGVDLEAADWSAAYQGCTRELWDFLGQGFVESLADLRVEGSRPFSLLIARKRVPLPAGELFSSRGIQVLGGRAASRGWDPLAGRLAAAEGAPRAASVKALKLGLRDPTLQVLQSYAPCLGTAALPPVATRVVWDRIAFWQASTLPVPWREVWCRIGATLAETVAVRTGCKVLAARQEGGAWKLRTSQGELEAERLVVAASPWQALDWLDRSAWPVPLLNLATRSRPVSLVTLTLPRGDEGEVAGSVLIPTEGVLLHEIEQGLVFQAAIDYEKSLDAAEVVKAIRRLRRAAKKIGAASTDGAGHIALMPVGWGQATDAGDQRFSQNLAGESYQQPHLGFCGDAYGPSARPDTNLIHSLLGLLRQMA